MGDKPNGTNGFELRGPDVENPLPHGTSLGKFMLDCLKRNAATRTNPAQIDAKTGEAKSYSELLGACVKGAEGWRRMGLKQSDTVAIYTRNNHHKYYATVGAIFEGITVAAIVPTANAEEMRPLLDRVSSTLRAIVCEPCNLNVALEVAPKGIPVIVAASKSPVDGVLTVEDLMRNDALPDTYKEVHIADLKEHVAAVVYSSGTTGLPKGVMITNYALVSTSVMCCRAGPFVVDGEVVLQTSPISWVTGFMYMITPIDKGCTRVLYNYTNETECLELILKYKVTNFFLAPARYFLLAGHVKSLREKGVTVDLSFTRMACVGGAAMSAHLQQTCSETLGVPILQAYGCTEHLLMTYDVSPPSYGSVGKLVPGMRMKFIDVATGENISEPHKIGEIRVKSPYYMKGYIGDPETTAKAVDEDGWYYTGDLAEFDEEGNIYVSDRIKELLKFMSLEMAPAEIEGVLMSHPAVKSACVVGRQHEVVGDIPTAFVELLPGRHATEDELKDHVKSRLSQNKQLRGGVFFVESIPTSSNGKFDRRNLRDRLAKLPAVSDQALGLVS